MPTFRIEIYLKDGIEDPEGNNTKKAMELIGFDGIDEVRSGKVYTVKTDKYTLEEMKEICDKLLVNPVIQKYKIEEIELD